MVATLSSVYSESLSVTADAALKASTETYYLEGGLADDIGATLLTRGEHYDIDVNLAMSNDGAIIPHSSYQLGHYFYTRGATAGFNFGDVSFTGGRGIHADVVDSPYTIYINPEAFPAIHAEAAYTGEVFSYTTRWVRLNERSAQYYNGDIDGDPATDTLIRDRGMTFKAYSLHFGNLTVGFEDVSLYLDRSFDAETFLSPFPMYFLEMLNTSAGRPWSELSNTNSLMGFFGEYETGDLYLCGQVLVDDINAGALAPILGWAIPSLNNIENLSKVAWSLGGTYDTPFGLFGFYHGGALKYTFAATYVSDSSYSTLPYEYTYFPVAEFDAGGGTYKPLDYTHNYIGYTHGENNLAFLADYTAEFGGRKPWAFGLYSSLEWVINGSKSPSNPWHEHDHWTEIDPPQELLTDEVLEHTLRLDVRLSKPVNNWLFAVDGALGYVWNRLELVEAVADEPKIYTPVAGNNHLIASLTLRAAYTLELGL